MSKNVAVYAVKIRDCRRIAKAVPVLRQNPPRSDQRAAGSLKLQAETSANLVIHVYRHMLAWCCASWLTYRNRKHLQDQRGA
jgi:hypothetical protein